MGELRWDYASLIYTDEPGMVAAKNELLRQSAVGQTACMGQVTRLLSGQNTALDFCLFLYLAVL